MWTWQKSCPGTALFRHRCPALVSPRHGVRGVSEDLGRGGEKKTSAPRPQKGSQSPKSVPGVRDVPSQAVLTRCCWPGTGSGCRVWVPGAAQLQNLAPKSPGRGTRRFSRAQRRSLVLQMSLYPPYPTIFPYFPYPTATPYGLTPYGFLLGMGCPGEGTELSPFFSGTSDVLPAAWGSPTITGGCSRNEGSARGIGGGDGLPAVSRGYGVTTGWHKGTVGFLEPPQPSPCRQLISILASSSCSNPILQSLGRKRGGKPRAPSPPRLVPRPHSPWGGPFSTHPPGRGARGHGKPTKTPSGTHSPPPTRTSAPSAGSEEHPRVLCPSPPAPYLSGVEVR